MRPQPVFVDTGGWCALQNRRDRHAETAVAVWGHILRTGRALVTTTDVIGETYTLLRARGTFELAWGSVERIRRLRMLRIHHVASELEESTLAILYRYREHPFSYVDAMSFATMQALGLREAFAFDVHFATAGFVRLGIDAPLA